MSSSTACSIFKEFFVKKPNRIFFILLGLSYVFGILFSGFGSEELYKSATFHIH